MLTGDLADFSLREILSFLATTSSSGVLELSSVEFTAGVAVRDGAICVALLDVNGVRGLAARMIRAGAVDLDQLQRVGGHQFDAFAWAAALGHGAGDPDVAAGVYLEHTYEALGWLTRVEEATFSFARSPQLDDWPFDAAAVDAVIAVVEERAAQWSDVPDGVSDLSSVCSLRPDPAGAGDVTVTTEQWTVLALIDGRRSVRDLIELSGVGYVDTCLLLHELVTAGLVELAAPGASTALATVLDGLGIERSVASPFAPARPRPPDALGSVRGPDVGLLGGATDGAAAVVVADDADGDPAPVGDPPDGGRAHVGDPADDGVPDTAADAALALDDEDASDANRTLIERLIGGKAAAG